MIHILEFSTTQIRARRKSRRGDIMGNLAAIPSSAACARDASWEAKKV
jgi:hypothetical protein